MTETPVTARTIIVTQPGPAEAMVWQDVPLPDPGTGEIRVRHLAVGVNFLDILMRSGRAGAAMPARLGVEGVAVVEAAGPGVDLMPGDRVVYAGGPPGAYSDRRTMPAARAVRLPDTIAPREAAALFFKGLTAQYLATRMRPLAPGDPVLVLAAAGGVGSLLARWLVNRGQRVIAAVGSADKVAAATATGAEAVLVVGRDDIAARVRDLTGGRGVQVVYDSVGRDTWDASVASLARFGLLVSYGWASGDPAVDLNTLRNAGSLFVTRPTIAHYTEDPADLQRAATEVFDLIAAGVLRFDAIETLPLDQVAQAHRRIESRQARGPVVLMADEG